MNDEDCVRPVRARFPKPQEDAESPEALKGQIEAMRREHQHTVQGLTERIKTLLIERDLLMQLVTRR